MLGRRPRTARCRHERNARLEPHDLPAGPGRRGRRPGARPRASPTPSASSSPRASSPAGPRRTTPTRESNDDSQRPIPGETVVLADLEGPGVVSHIWLTVAANEYGWPRLLRLRVYYDGSADAERRRAPRRLLRRGPRLREARPLADGARRARRAARATATGRCPSAGPAGSRSPTRAAAASPTSTTTWTGRRSPALPEGTPYFHARYRQALPAPADGSPLRDPERARAGPLRRHRAVGRPGRGRLVRRGRRLLLGRRRDEALHRGHGQRGLLQRRLGAARRRRARTTGVTVAEGTGLGSRMTAYRWHLADPVPFTKSLALRDRAQGLDLQRRRLREVGLRRAHRPHLERRLLVPGGHRRRPAAGALRLRAPAPGQRRPDRGREVALRRGAGREGQGLPRPRALLVQGRDPLRGGGARAPASRSPSTSPRTATTRSTPRSRRPRTTAPTPCSSTASRRTAPQLEHEPGADVRPQTQFDGYAVETYVGRGLPGRLAAPRQGPPHADLRLPRPERGLHRLQPRRRHHRAREDGRCGLGRGRRGARAEAPGRGASPISPAPSPIPTPSRAASPRWRCARGERTPAPPSTPSSER